MGRSTLSVFTPSFVSFFSVLNWTTGAGTARYWTLKLLIDHFAVGDAVVSTTVVPPTSSPFCGYVLNLNNISLVCPTGVISSIDFASYGTPTGACPAYAVGTCNAANTTAYVTAGCLGKPSCNLYYGTSTLGDPCFDVLKHAAVVARCSSGGGYSPQAPSGADVYAQAFSAGSVRKVLLVNKGMATVQAVVQGAAGGRAYTVDEATQDGPPAVSTPGSDTLTLAPWAVVVVFLA